MADREKSFTAEQERTGDLFGSQKSLSNVKPVSPGMQTYAASGMQGLSSNLPPKKFGPQQTQINGTLKGDTATARKLQSTFNKPVVVRKEVPTFVPKPIEVSVDGGRVAMCNAMNSDDVNHSNKDPMLTSHLNNFPATEETMSRGYPKTVPHWIIITGTYSAVFICILLISRSLPTQDGGKLYIYFTAFWSLLLYFLTDSDVTDYYASDPLDDVVQSVVSKAKI